jgi:hypothetical protein
MTESINFKSRGKPTPTHYCSGRTATDYSDKPDLFGRIWGLCVACNHWIVMRPQGGLVAHALPAPKS